MQQPRQAAEKLYHCLLELGQQQSNPVLEAIEHSSTITQEKKYPDGLLRFNDKGWRAYYHCHANNNNLAHLFRQEHGHFHLFTRTQEQHEQNADSWSHVVALSMDEMGQPLRWFMVNHWVTGEKWCEAEKLINQLRNIPVESQEILLERWLLSMLLIFQQHIISMLNERDKVINSYNTPSILQDRKLYLINETSINLPKKLAELLK